MLAMLSRVDESVQCTQALCICPTRELVVQNLEVLQKMGRHTKIQATSTARAETEVPRSVAGAAVLSCKPWVVTCVLHPQGSKNN